MINSFLLSDDWFEFALFIDAQRWTVQEFFPSWPRKVGYYPLGVRTELVRMLKKVTANEWVGGMYLGGARSLDPAMRKSEWRARPRPVWRVIIYGIAWNFDRYMTADMVAAMIHENHRTLKGTTHWWCIICNPERGGTASDLGPIEAEDADTAFRELSVIRGALS